MKTAEMQLMCKNDWISDHINVMFIFLLTIPRGYKTFFVLNSADHEIYLAHKC